MLNMARDLGTPQGLNKEYRYEAIVVNNDDSKTNAPHTCRIQARVDILFDGIADDHLPWAIPFFEHPNGASKDSGRAFLPKVGSKVILTFQEGRETHPMWSGYAVDKSTVMEEMKHNYPNRVVTKMKNNAITVYDTQTNELFIRNPGDLKIYIQGDAEITVMGNVKEVVKGNKEVFIEGGLTENIKGDYKRVVGGDETQSVKGDSTITVGGDETQSIKGDYKRAVGGDENTSVSGDAKKSVNGNWKHSTGGESSIQVTGAQVNNAGQMNDQVGGPDVDSADSPDSAKDVDASPDLTKWPGFPGGAKGNAT